MSIPRHLGIEVFKKPKEFQRRFLMLSQPEKKKQGDGWASGGDLHSASLTRPFCSFDMSRDGLGFTVEDRARLGRDRGRVRFRDRRAHRDSSAGEVALL